VIVNVGLHYKWHPGIRSLETHRTSDLADDVERSLRIATVREFAVSCIKYQQSNDRRDDRSQDEAS
jgi:hypothetical protein